MNPSIHIIVEPASAHLKSLIVQVRGGGGAAGENQHKCAVGVTEPFWCD